MSIELATDQPLVGGFVLGDDWEVRPLAGVLRRNGVERHLEPRVMDVLVCLARSQGQVVTRDQLLDEVWGNVVVTDDAITRCISELRMVLGDTGRTRICIRTIPRRGYSLLLPVAPLAATSDSNHGPKLSLIAGAAGSPRLTGLEPTADGDAARERSMQAAMRRGGAAAVIVILAVVGAGLLLSGNALSRLWSPATENAVHETQEITASGSGPAPQAGAEGKSGVGISSLAVLPFVSLGGDDDDDLFSDGLSEDIRNTLMSYSDLRVAARTSSSVFKGKAMDVRDIAAQLNVDALLEGTVRINNGRLRVTTQLTDAVNGYSVWAASYERDVDDKTQLQTEVAGEIAKQLGLSLTNDPVPRQGATSNVQAHDYYLLGRHYWHERTAGALSQAEHYFNEALTLDPGFALAWSGLADALIFQATYGKRRLAEVEEKARIAVTRALELEPQLAEAHASLGLLREHTGDLEGAKTAYQHAVDLKPQYAMAQMWLGNIWMETRDLNRAHDHYGQALEVDPLHETIQYNYANSLIGLGRYGEALRALDHFAHFGQRDVLLRAQLQAQLDLGHYDKVLDIAVAHIYSGELQPHAELAVIEALIQLGRLDEAARMISDNAEVIADWPQAWLQASLSVARRDPQGLNDAAAFFQSPEFQFGRIEPQCGAVMSVYLRGLAANLGARHALAERLFSQFHLLAGQRTCSVVEPEIRLAALLYQARSRLRLNVDQRPAAALLARARGELDTLRAKGWNSVTINAIDIAQQLLAGDRNAALAIVEQMAARGWQPFGLLRSSPLFDEFLEAEIGNPTLALLKREYDVIHMRCDDIGLAKLGL